MSEIIVNKVANSQLINIDLEDFYPKGGRVLLDIKDWLFAGQILKEKEFRTSVKDHDWKLYKNKYVALYCSVEAIIPSWAYLLITTKLAPFSKKIVVGNLEVLETSIFQEVIGSLDMEKYINKPVIIKGCSNKSIPDTSYVQLVGKLLPIARSIMYGEACSNVPLYKK